jgi:tRNA threonylcarbamoyladenosine biosynthesis protein TsaB
MNLWIRTDKPDAELHVVDPGGSVVASKSWHAYRQLGMDLLPATIDLLASVGKSVHQIEHIYVYQGPGSFTGLRIGISISNALAYGICIPICGVNDNEWASKGQPVGNNGAYVLPHYGRDPHITVPKK